MRYDYKCSNCDHEFELEQRISDPIKRKCPECKKLKLERILYEVPFVRNFTNTLGSYLDKVQNTGEMQEKTIKHDIEMKEKRKAGLEELERKLPKGMSTKRPT